MLWLIHLRTYGYPFGGGYFLYSFAFQHSTFNIQRSLLSLPFYTQLSVDCCLLTFFTIFTFSLHLSSYTIDFVETASLVLCVNKFSPTRLLAVFTIHRSPFTVQRSLLSLLSPFTLHRSPFIVLHPASSSI